MDRKKLVAGTATVAVPAFGGGGIAYATGDAGEQATGLGIEKAKSAALDHTGGSRVTGTEVGDEEGYYEIEVAQGDGNRVGVHLDRELNVLGTLSDHESPHGEDEPDDN